MHHHQPTEIIDFPETTGTKRYTITYWKSPFIEAPEVELPNLSWATVRKFALGNVYPDGWRVIEEESGHELDLEEIGCAYAALSR